MSCGTVRINIVVEKPSPKIWNRIKSYVFFKTCAKCKRKQGDRNDDKTFRGVPRNGLCPRCNSQYLRETLELKHDERQLEAYVENKVQAGECIPRELLVLIKREIRMDTAAGRGS